jgi:hypothetical protein
MVARKKLGRPCDESITIARPEQRQRNCPFSSERGTARTKARDLPDGTREIFFARGLDASSVNPHVGQISLGVNRGNHSEGIAESRRVTQRACFVHRHRATGDVTARTHKFKVVDGLPLWREFRTQVSQCGTVSASTLGRLHQRRVLGRPTSRPQDDIASVSLTRAGL